MALSTRIDGGRKARSGNRDRIVDASLALFNEDGVRSVTTNHIAAHLSISPGNLYYHYRNKEEIIRQIFPRIADAVRAALTLPDEGPITAEDLGAYHITGARALWEYRFFFRERSELLARDALLARQYRRLHGWVIERFVTLFRHLLAQGHMDLGDFHDDIERVATNAVILWMSWLNFVTTARPRSNIERHDIVEGALQSFLTFAPFLDERFVRAVRSAIYAWGDAGER